LLVGVIMLIGELLVQNGLISDQQLNQALALQSAQGKKLGLILLELGYINSSNIIKMVSEQVAVSFLELKREMIDEKLLRRFPQKLLYNETLIPLFEKEGSVMVAFGDPTKREKIIDTVKRFSNKEVKCFSADPGQIKRLLNEIFFDDRN
jgi:type IV pilus assembly protein PilB